MAGEGALQGLSLAVVETGGWCPIHTPTMEVQAVERGVACAEPAYQEAAPGMFHLVLQAAFLTGAVTADLLLPPGPAFMAHQSLTAANTSCTGGLGRWASPTGFLPYKEAPQPRRAPGHSQHAGATATALACPASGHR